MHLSLRNVRLCIDGQLHPQAQVDIDTGTGKIVESGDHPNHNTIDLDNAIIAPEGPYLQPLKKGAHNASFFQSPTVPAEDIYGDEGLAATKVVTLAPENEGSLDLIKNLSQKGIMVSLGHSNATYNQGLAAVEAGANVATMLFKSNSKKCILITDSIELAGLPDGTYPGHSQIPFNQTKIGSKVVIEGTETLIGGCASLSECVQNLVRWSGCSIAEAVRCVTENVAKLMALEDRGILEPGRRADFVVLDDEANVLQTWIGGVKVWDIQHGGNS
ncbi:N-acetylglucosamine-6-phosphate deacetylase [Pseudocercospora fuligena]|uniref:N-acetylglucosamine-6-phosphate deacetylase n=1 Tax=Pseudocercospora fuligena TaxID=685502 RepID=A0A8H6RRJ1_9PEZI|nr:N-acetylglucosamine-6-phosphate deacetylase [Pseudocercospora fuligena]